MLKASQHCLFKHCLDAFSMTNSMCYPRFFKRKDLFFKLYYLRSKELRQVAYEA